VLKVAGTAIDDSKVIRFKKIKGIINEFKKDFLERRMFSRLFQCGGVNWKLVLDLTIHEQREEEHAKMCVGERAEECPHYSIVVYWSPQKPGEDEEDYFPIYKKLSVLLVNDVGVVVEKSLLTFENGKFVSPAFKDFNDKGGRGWAVLRGNEQVAKLLTNGRDEFVFKATVTDI